MSGDDSRTLRETLTPHNCHPEPSDLGHSLRKWSYWWCFSAILTRTLGVEHKVSYEGVKTRSLKESCAWPTPQNTHRVNSYRERWV